MQGLGKDKVDVIKTRFMYVLTFARWGLPAVYASAVIAIAISGMSNIYIWNRLCEAGQRNEEHIKIPNEQENLIT